MSPSEDPSSPTGWSSDAATEAASPSACTRRTLTPVRSAIASVDGEPIGNRSSSPSARVIAASRAEAWDVILIIRASPTASASERRIGQTAYVENFTPRR